MWSTPCAKPRRDEGLFKRLGARWFYRLVNAGARFQVPADAGDFRLMDRAVVDALLALPERNRFMKGLYAWVGFKTSEIAYVPDARGSGRSTFNPFHLLRLSFDGLTAFTTWPLRIASLLGFILALLAFAYGGYLVVDYFLRGIAVPGWTTIVVGLMLFSGIQLIGLGVLGSMSVASSRRSRGAPCTWSGVAPDGAAGCAAMIAGWNRKEAGWFLLALAWLALTLGSGRLPCLTRGATSAWPGKC